MAALPRGQTEAAYAIGLTRGAALRLILLPQAFRLMLPALDQPAGRDPEGHVARGFIIATRSCSAGAIAVQNLGNPLQLYLLVGMLFILINLVLTRLAGVISRGPSRRLRH